MKNMHRISAIILGAACAVAMGSAFADARTAAYDESDDFRVGINVLGDDRINLDGDDVVIEAKDGSRARVTAAGDLYINDKAVAVNDGERKLLRRYHLGIHNIQDRGLQIGRDALHLAGGIIGVVMTDLFSAGDVDDKRIDRDAERQAEPIKQEARALCNDVRSERQLQNALVAQLPVFQPYAVIHSDSDHDCHVDQNDTEV